MKRQTLTSLVWLLAVAGLLPANASAATPVISNISVSQRAGTKLVDIYYTLADASGHACTVWINVSGDGGVTWTIPASSLSGNVGAGVTPGTGRHIVWNAGQDWNGQLVSNCKVRVFANDGTTPIPPAGMVYIPAGSFQMGDNLDSMAEANPVHNVQLDAFFMDETEVTGAKWLDVRTWAVGNGYGIDVGSYKEFTHPAQYMSWYDAVKWCNARSEREGLTPVYYTNHAQTNVYKTGSLTISNACVKWVANGYRLPTEAEWEKAARGGVQGQRFPLDNTISHAQANYSGQTSISYDLSGVNDYHPTYKNGGIPYTSPVGSFPPNGYGLYDMTGNIWEWCWDWYGSTYYALDASLSNPRGPTTGTLRLTRGGLWGGGANDARSAKRGFALPNDPNNTRGFRCVREQ